MPLTRTEKLERSLTHSAGKMCFKSSRKLQLSLLHAQRAGITFYTCLKDLTTVRDALSTVNCKLQSYPAAKNQSAKSWNILLSPDANNNPPSPSEILILELGEKRTEGRENSWQDLQLAANQNLGCSKVTALKPDCSTWRRALGESTGILFKWLGRAGSPDDAD